MSINEFLEKIKPFYYLFLIIVLVLISFALNRIYTIESGHTPIRISYPNSQMANQGSNMVIGSKSGKKYYFPWCGTVSRIKPENQIHFASVILAKEAGYTPASNCKGLK